MKRLVLLLMLLGTTLSGMAKDKYYVRMADSEMRRFPESWMVDFNTRPGWNYCSGLELGAIWKVWEKTGDEKYRDYVLDYADTMVNAEGNILRYNFFEYSVDRINTGKLLFPVYQYTGEERYRKALYLQRAQMASHPRTEDGGYWHKKIYPHQMWLDGIYMADAFLAQYGAAFGNPDLITEAAEQIVLIASHTLDPATGLYYHGWDESREQRWANKQTGQSPNFWSRAMGWYAMAIVDVLEVMPANHPERPAVLKILREMSAALEKYRDPATGMWYQVTDVMDSRPGNYLESSGSIMFIYTWKKAADRGWLPASYKRKAAEAYDQFLRRFVKENPDGTISVTDAVSVSGLGGSPRYRDGSYEYYLSEPIRLNDPKAVGPFILTSLMFNK